MATVPDAMPRAFPATAKRRPRRDKSAARPRHRPRKRGTKVRAPPGTASCRPATRASARATASGCCVERGCRGQGWPGPRARRRRPTTRSERRRFPWRSPPVPRVVAAVRAGPGSAPASGRPSIPTRTARISRADRRPGSARPATIQPWPNACRAGSGTNRFRFRWPRTQIPAASPPAVGGLRFPWTAGRREASPGATGVALAWSA